MVKWNDDGTWQAECAGCGKVDPDIYGERERPSHHCWQRSDYYGIPTGMYCDECYDGVGYPYSKMKYFDPSYAGEQLEPDD